jgi:hypothetical protein
MLPRPNLALPAKPNMNAVQMHTHNSGRRTPLPVYHFCTRRAGIAYTRPSIRFRLIFVLTTPPKP